MKKFLPVLTLGLLISFTTNAKTYYVSSSGNDSNTGLSTSAPWKTLSKVNSFTGFVAGDVILFNRGEVFYGSITIKNSGTSGNPITYGAYGSGAKPVITGFTTVSGWTNLGGNIWESSSSVSTLSTLKIVSINAVNTPVGRYPNSGYLTFQSHTGTTSITSSSLTGSPNWTGADVVIRTYRWAWDKGTITSQSGGKLTYSGGTATPSLDNWGFFIQNDVRTLDAQNEWYYNPSTKKIRIYSTTSPGNVQAASVDALLNCSSKNYITIDNIAFKGANSAALYFSAASHITVTNCDISYAGVDGIQINSTCSYPDIEYNTTTECNNSGIASYSQGETNVTIKYNTIKKSGLIPGTTQRNFYSYGAINCGGPYSLIQYNQVDSSGYCGILFNGLNSKVLNNFVNHSCIIKDDGGGIYTSGTETGKEISGNIVLNTVGYAGGTSTTDLLAEGIFLDDNVNNMNVLNNTIGSCNSVGLLLHNTYKITIKNNTIYDSKGLGFMRSAMMIQGDASGSAVRNLDVKNNIFFAKDATQYCFFYYNTISAADAKLYASSDSNYYARPLDNNNMIRLFAASVTTYYNPTAWNVFSAQDPHSKASSKTTSTVNDLRFEYNATSSNKTISLDANYIDARSVSYNGSITLAPYTSAVLIKNGAITGNKPPVANAGSNSNITLPTSTATLLGSGTDADGTISNYTWTKMSGPTATIVSPSSATTLLTGLTQGTYQFQLMVTDNKGATATDVVQVAVNAAGGGGSFFARAGDDQNVTTNSVSLVGWASDGTKDVVAASYNWTKISGPSSGTIITPNINATVVTNLVQGVYQFQLKAISLSGVSSTDVVQVTVNGGTTIFARANKDQTITLPTNSVNLIGWASDGTKDEVAASYNWAKISGPSSGTITKPNSNSTAVTNLVQGTYQFQLKVISFSGISSTDVMQVTVKAAGVGANFSQLDPIISNSEQRTGLTVYPNPFIDHFDININGIVTGEFKLVLFDAAGKMLWSRNVSNSGTSYHETVNTPAFARGIYFLKLIQNNNSSVVKLVK